MIQKNVQTFVIKSYECDRDFNLRLMSLFNQFQHAADMSAEVMGVGYEACRQKGLGWVGVNYRLRIDRLPRWRDVVTLTTWPSGQTAACGIREFNMTDAAGERLVCATSQWALLDTAKMRPVRLRQAFPNLAFIDERVIADDFDEVPPVARADFVKKITIDFDHLDFNDHVNNARYPVWSAQAVPTDFYDAHAPHDLRIAFKRPAVLGDTIVIETQVDGLETRHRFLSLDQKTAFALAHIAWRPKE